MLPPGCTFQCVTASAGCVYPEVFNNALVDEHFGITSSKSELALNLSTGGKQVTFMGYLAPVDVSNGSTPGVFDPTNTDPVTAYRVVARVDSQGRVHTVYFVDTSGHACPHGVGLPEPGAKLPSAAIAPIVEGL